jgi:hypothetical protein
MLIPDARESVFPLQGNSIDRNDSVSCLQSGVLGRAAGYNTLHKLGVVSGKVFVVEAQFNKGPAATKKDPHGRVKNTGSGKQQRQCDQQRPWWRREDGHNSDITESGLYFLEQEHQFNPLDAAMEESENRLELIPGHVREFHHLPPPKRVFALECARNATRS